MSDKKQKDVASVAFGPNSWLIDEMYRQFQANPDSVGESWRDFFEDYKPGLPQADSVVPESSTIAELRPKVEPKKDEKSLPPGAVPIRGPMQRIVDNMERSLSVPTATSTRIIPVKILEENRRLINDYLANAVGGKVSFTHIIAWAILKALKKMPNMTASYRVIDGQPYKILPEHINFGLAVDVEKKDGSRSLLVPNIKRADEYDFRGFFNAYNDIIRKVRTNRIEPEDFMDTTVTLTNPGTIGTVHSIPRLMAGQGLIVATGGIQYPPEWEAADPRTLAQLGISKVMAVTSTYDHRIIQGAESGLFLQYLHRLLEGEEDFYDEIFENLQIPHQAVRMQRDINPVFGEVMAQAGSGIEKQARVLQLINMYRVRGHLIAHLDPLNPEIKYHPELDPERYGFTVWDYDREFITGGLAGKDRATLREILDILREAYCQTIGVEYMHIQEPEQKEWIQKRVEGVRRSDWMDLETKRHILAKLNAAEAFERFLHTKYVGHKRFSLEGAESLIPMLDALVEKAIDYGLEEMVMGMAHRGRLNVLANIVGKPLEKIFREFEGDLDPESQQGSGDVKYHLGATGTHTREDGKSLKIMLASNPSHLEAVDPVVEGMARARQDLHNDESHDKVLPVLIHGDAAFAGQGVVAETLNLSALKGYRTGGTVHIVVNNGIGFTTDAMDARSSVYATDIAKMVQAPIFHVNGDDPEACVRVITLALAFRQAFKKDVVVDMVCYRRHGHNESDEPSYTQPIMYKKIKERRSVRKLYTELLVKRGDLSIDEAEEALKDFQSRLEAAFEATRESAPPKVQLVTVETPPEMLEPVIPTGVPRELLDEIIQALTTVPPGFTVHPKLNRQILAKRKQYESGSVDWALGEAFAFGSLLAEGIPVRLSGQDSRRGTFSQRHAVLVDYNTEEEYTPLNHIRADQAPLMIYDSLLSEYAVMGFEYGYSVIRKDALVCWEAQFGDFANGAQIIIDQFLSSAEDKWNQTSGLVLLLPHGYEGQGPEHSSARLERFLTLCAESNMRVTVPTTAAQYFHLLRRQARFDVKKPLVVMTPKSLLRAEASKSHTDEFVQGHFQYVLDDPQSPEAATRILFCSGKVAFDLMKYRETHNITNTAIIRIEQLYPFPFEPVRELLKKYHQAKDIRWVQEEPRNMGAWNFVQWRLSELLRRNQKLSYVGRLPSGSPATGSYHVHMAEQEWLVQQAFA